MKKITILLSILLWAVLSIAQSSWVSQTSGTTEDIAAIQMADQNVGYYVTKNSNYLIFKTSNGGDSWSQIGTGNYLEDLFVFDQNTLYVCGEHIQYSNDGGNTFTNQTTSGSYYYAITFGSTNYGWVCGYTGSLESTTDGTNWSTQTSGTTENLFDIHAVDANNVWACGASGTIIHTSDGGANWTTQTTPTTQGLNAIYFVDQNTGYAVGELGVILKTTNGGSTWNNLTAASQPLRDVYFLSSSEGYIVGNQGFVMKTTDGGSTWNTQVSGTTELLWSVNFIDSNNGWIAGMSGTIGFTDHGGDLCTTHADFTVNESCPGTISMTNASTGNFLTGGPDYVWSWEGTQFATTTDASYGPVSADTYDILLEVTDGNCSDDTTVTWLIHQIDTTITTDEFCEGDTYDFFGTPLTSPGVYYYTTPSLVTGCDSVTELTLSLNLIDTTLTTDEFCEGDTYDFFGTPLTAPGVYYYTTPSLVTGCDSVTELTLSMNLIDTVVVDESFCQGGTFNWNGSDYTAPGTYYYTTTDLTTGCDSVVQLNLTENPTYYIQETQEICDGDSYIWPVTGNPYTTAGIYTETFSTVGTGCDSIHELELIVHPTYDFTTTENICAGDSVEWRGNWYYTTGIYIEPYTTTVTGCDSIYTLDLTVNALPTNYLVQTIPSNGILPAATTGEITVSWSDVGDIYWVELGTIHVTGNIPGTGALLSLGTTYGPGTYDVWSANTAGCELKQGTVTFVEDNGTTKIVGTPTYGNTFNSFADGAVEMTLYFSTTDIYGDPVILLEDGPTATAGGNVEFDNLSDGDYYLKSELIDTATYPTVVPIFFFDGPTVDSADVISVISGDILAVNVNHPEFPDTTGSNTAGGTVDTLGGTKSGGLPDQVVILRNEVTGDILSAVVTNDFGEYFIANVPDNSDLELYVTSFEYQNWVPAGFTSATNTHYEVNFIASGDSVYPDGWTNVIDPIPLLEFSLYPNPAKDIIYLENVPEGSTLQIFDQMGRLVLGDMRHSKNSLDISSLKTGTYVVTITTKDGRSGVHKLMKQ